MSQVLRNAVYAVALVALATACDKDKAKPDESKKTEPTPVPSDLVFNDFLPTTGNAAGLGVRDAGLEGGLAAVVPGGEPGAEPAPHEGGKLHVIEPGNEPRAVRKYMLTASRADKRVLTLTQSVSQSMQGQTSQPQEITLKMFLDFTPKTVKPAGANVEAKLTKIELPGAPPQAAALTSALAGLSGTFDVTAQGEVSEVSFTATQQMKNQLAETAVQGLSQGVQLLLAPFPEAPIGVGAKWEAPPGPGEQGTKSFTLKELSGETAVVEADIQIKVPRRPQQGPRGQAMFVEVDGKGHYVYQVRFDRMSTKVEGELVLNEKIEVADPNGKQSLVQTQKAKHLLETAK
jgi:hypothetical protein